MRSVLYFLAVVALTLTVPPSEPPLHRSIGLAVNITVFFVVRSAMRRRPEVTE